MIKVDYGETDADLALTMRELTMALNAGAEIANRRELMVRYDVKPQKDANPRLNVNVMMEVA